jgi:hypothetical protein
VPVLDDAVLVVLGGSSGLITDQEYLTMASNQEVLIDDPAQATKELASAGLGDYVLGMSPLAGDAAASYRNAQNALVVQMFNVAAGALVLLATALSVSIVYVEREAQTVFTKYISGWAFARIHWRLLSAELALSASLVLWIWHRTAAAGHEPGVPGARPADLDTLFLSGRQPVVAAGVALLSLLIITATLLRSNSRLVKSRSAAVA